MHLIPIFLRLIGNFRAASPERADHSLNAFLSFFRALLKLNREKAKVLRYDRQAGILHLG
ncbi:hypothetical protein D3C84_1013590 [compost metagenome]